MNKLKMVNKNIGLFGTYLFIFSIFISKAGQNIGLGLAFLSLLLGCIFFKEKLNFGNKKIMYSLLILYLGVAFLDIFSDGGINSSLDVLSNRYKLLSPMILMFFITDKKKLVRFIILLLASLLISSLYGLYNWNFIMQKRLDSFIYCMDLGHMLGTILPVVFTLIFIVKNKFYKIGIFIIYLLGFSNLIFTQTRGAWLAFWAGMTIVLYLYNKKSLMYFLIIGGLLFIILPGPLKSRVKSITDVENNSSNTARIFLWKASLDTFLKNPIFGAGAGNNDKWFNLYKKKINSEHNTYGGASHNMYLNFLSNHGIIFIYYIYFLFYIIPKIILKNMRVSDGNRDYSLLLIGVTGGIVGFYVSGLTNNVWTVMPTSYAFFVLLFILNFMDRETKKELE